MPENFWPSAALYTNDMPKDYSEEWFFVLKNQTDERIKKEFPFYVNKKMWPLKAAKKGGADKTPKFAVWHHTSNRERNHKPAMHRFFQASMASSNFLVTSDGFPLYIVDLEDMSYHATVNTFIPLAMRRTLGLEGKWLNEPGIEVAGNGNSKLFTYEQLLSCCILGRHLKCLFPSMTEAKSHRFFSPTQRSGDPGPLFFLPLVEHSIFNDVSLVDSTYWLQDYKKDPVKFANRSSEVIKKYGLDSRDEWSTQRKRLKVNNSFL